MQTWLIYNPTAGNGKATHLYRALEPRLHQAGVQTLTTEYAGHATHLARSCGSSEGTVISLGGDGTHHEVINGLLPETKAVLAVLPAGTGNDFVRVLGYPAEPEAMLETALHGAIRSVDVGRVGEQYFLTVAGVGFDAEVAGWVNQRKKVGTGRSVFVRGILHNLLHYRPQPIRVELDTPNGKLTRSTNTFMIAAANTPYYAGGMQIAPHANPQNGLLSVVWIEHLNRWQVLPMLARVLRGTHLAHPRVKTYAISRMTVDGSPDLWVHADGEILGHLPVDIEVIPSAIRVRTGNR